MAASTVSKGYLALIPKLDSGAEAQIKNSLSGIDASSSGTKIGAGLGKGILKAFAAIGVATLIADTIKSSIESFAQYEQLVGGVETLFKDSASVIEQYASDAYKTAGLSANAYMEQATSFSASLIQSLGGDTAKAAEYSNMAITDMSDNANKMGTNISRIQDAYQGFAMQNYIMLDNLKLGYGGTKSEMERLIEDANALREAQGLNADLTIDSYADIVDAIHTVQTEMGITGTTAAEAATTIEGSVNSMKGAWDNWLTAIAGGGDVEKASQDLITTVTTVIQNLIPVLGTLLEQLVAALPDIIMALIPVLIVAIFNLGNQIFATLGEVLAQLLIQLAVFTYNVIAAIGEFFSGIWTGICSFIDSVLAGISEFINGIWNSITSFVATTISSIAEFFANVWAAITGFFSNAISGAASFFSDVVSGIGSFVANAVSSIAGFVSSIGSFFSGLWSSVTSVASSMWSSVTSSFWNGVSSAIGAVSSLPGQVIGIFSGVGGWLVDSGWSLISGFVDGVWRAIDWAADSISGALSGLSALFPHSPAKKGPFSGKGWTLYSGMSTAEAFGEGFAKKAGSVESVVDDALSGVSMRMPSASDVETQADGGYDSIANDVYLAVKQALEESAIAVNIDGRQLALSTAGYMDAELATIQARRAR